jgi:hypothetical protein
MNVMTAIVFAVTRDPGNSRPTGHIQPQYLPALAQSRLLQLRFAGLHKSWRGRLSVGASVASPRATEQS